MIRLSLPIRRFAVVFVALVLVVACSDDSSPAEPEAGTSTTAATVDGDAQEVDDGGGSDVGGGSEGGIAGPVFDRIPDIVREVEPSVVAVLTDVGEGSGVVWDADGTIVTNNHVVAGARTFEVAFADGDRVAAELIAVDPLTDLAILRAERQELPPADFATELPEVGELAIAIGNPLGFENTATAGIVSGLHRSIPGSASTTQSLIDLIQTDAPISPGNSGGALVDAEGRVMGINVAYIPPAASAVSIGFAIPATTVTDVVEQLLEDGTVSHAYLGLHPAPLTPQIKQQLRVEADEGVVVLDVVFASPAATAGLAPGDVITEVEGEPVPTVEAFLATLRGREPGDEMVVRVVRGGEELELSIILGDRSDEVSG
ncbi:MAG: trypsin-like peptidase domain-containing protein [Acidimicrobiia bacterium]|nr:trypsin-like peptidase domain-containing protein [Acidimicrobiia bacterium]